MVLESHFLVQYFYAVNLKGEESQTKVGTKHDRQVSSENTNIENTPLPSSVFISPLFTSLQQTSIMPDNSFCSLRYLYLEGSLIHSHIFNSEIPLHIYFPSQLKFSSHLYLDFLFYCVENTISARIVFYVLLLLLSSTVYTIN